MVKSSSWVRALPPRDRSPGSPGLHGCAYSLNLLLGAAGQRIANPRGTRNSAMAVSADLDHVTRCAELVDGVSQDELHANTFLS